MTTFQNYASVPSQRFGKAIDREDDVRELIARTIASETSYYRNLFTSLQPARAWLSRIDAIIDRVMLANRGRYSDVGRRADETPWFLVAIIHQMEGSSDFATHLHNGDPLTSRTVQVPSGRPASGNPPFSWEASAIDALTFDGVAAQDDWTIEGLLFRLESFNGFGYRNKNIVSPYLAAQSNAWTKGKYVRDGVFDPNAGSSQIGAAVFLKRMIQRNLISLGNSDTATPTNPSRPLPPSARPELGRGSTGAWVEVLQNLLNGCGYMPTLELDGDFGPQTERTVRAFQRDLGLEVDGGVGPITWAALDAHAKLPGWTPVIPGAAPAQGSLRDAVVKLARSIAGQGRSHAPGNWVDSNILDPLRPAMVALGHLGSTQKDDFWNWCAAWVTYTLRQAGIKMPDRFPGAGQWATVALVEMWDQYARAIGAWIPRGSKAPRPGDVAIFDWDGDRYADHIGILLEYDAGTREFICAEGNRGNRESLTRRTLSTIEGFVDLDILVGKVGTKS
jgi:lysozyme family protein